MKNFFESVTLYAWGLFVIFLEFCLNGFIVMIVWNKFMPDLLGLHRMTFWQGFWMSLFCFLLFKNSATATVKKIDND